MEIVFKVGNKKKKVNIEPSIITIQGPDEIIDNLSKDYEISLIDNKELFFVGDNLLSEIFLYNDTPDLEFVNQIMYIIGNDSDFLNKDILKFSMTDKILSNIYRNLSYNKDIIVFNDVFKGLDVNYHKKLINLFSYLVSKNYIVILKSDDVNKMYQYGKYSLVANKTSIKYGTSEDIYSDIDLLIKLKLEIPTLSYITYKAKKDKNIKLFYSKDVRDLIKDVYKHV